MEKLAKPIRERVVAKIALLAESPRPSGCAKLTGTDGFWRVRVADWRIVYLIDDEARSLDIRIVAHRSEVYRGI